MSLTQTLAGAGFLSRGAPAPAALRDRAEQAAAVLPPLLVAAERVAVTVAQGVHGRRRVGQGETFWQFRQYEPGDAATRIDWRESAKSQRLYVRETEWEAAQSVWLWRDASASMNYTSADYMPGAEWPIKRDRAELLLVALASLLVRGGERLTVLGSGMAPISGRIALSRVAELIGRDQLDAVSLPAALLASPDGRRVLFAGGRKSGKTTLALGLLSAGWTSARPTRSGQASRCPRGRAPSRERSSPPTPTPDGASARSRTARRGITRCRTTTAPSGRTTTR